MRRQSLRPCALILAALLTSTLSAQHLVFSSNPIPPGSTVSITVVNSGPTTVSTTSDFRVFTEEGDVVYGAPYRDLGSSTLLAPGQSSSPIPFNSATTAGVPLGVGHYFVEVLGGPGSPSAVGRLTVGGPGTPAPAFLFRQSGGLSLYEPSTGSPSLRVSNGTPTPLTLTNICWNATTPASGVVLGAGVFAPSVVTIPAGQSVDFAWPAAALAPTGQTRELHSMWFDAAQNLISPVNEIGPQQPPAHLAAELYFPRGRTVPLGGFLPLFVESLATVLPGGVMTSTGQDAFALLFSLSPGAIPLPGGAVLPLAPDALLIATVTGALAPWVTGSPGLTLPAHQTSILIPRQGTLGIANLYHPGPAVSGAVVHVAGVAFSSSFPPGNVWQSSPLRTLVLQ